MQPFNVKIGQRLDCELYTVLPGRSGYAVMLNDNVVAVIAEEEGKWIEKEPDAFDFKDLSHEKGQSLSEEVVEELGKEINLALAGLPEPDQEDRCEP